MILFEKLYSTALKFARFRVQTWFFLSSHRKSQSCVPVEKLASIRYHYVPVVPMRKHLNRLRTSVRYFQCLIEGVRMNWYERAVFWLC